MDGSRCLLQDNEYSCRKAGDEVVLIIWWNENSAEHKYLNRKVVGFLFYSNSVEI